MSDVTAGQTPASISAAQTDAKPAAQAHYFTAWRWHFYASLYVIPFIILLSVTGIMMVWFSAITSEYGDRTPLTPSGQVMSITAQQEAALARYPAGKIDQYIAPRSEDTPALVRVVADGEKHVLALNPYTGEVLKDKIFGDTWEEFADHLHGELGLSKPNKAYGDFFVELAASLSMLLVVTGVYLAWPRNGATWRQALLPKLSAQGRSLWKSLHTAIGLWGGLILVLFLLSGLSWAGIWGGKIVQPWSAFPAEKWDAVPQSDKTHASLNEGWKEEVPWALEQMPLPASGSDAGLAGIPEGVPVALESVVWLARQNGFEGRFQVAFPADETGVWTISRDSMSNDNEDPTTDRTVHIDQYTGKILADIGFGDYGAMGKTMAVGIPLHMGLMGWFNALVNIAFCLVLIAASVTGLVMWWKRRPENAGRLAAPPKPQAPLWKAGLVLVALTGLAFPVGGAALLLIVVLDWAVFSRLPALKRALS